MVFNARNYVYSNLCIGVMGFNSLDSLYNIRCIISIKGTTNDDDGFGSVCIGEFEGLRGIARDECVFESVRDIT